MPGACCSRGFGDPMTWLAAAVVIFVLGFGIRLVLNAVAEIKEQQEHTHRVLLEELQKRR